MDSAEARERVLSAADELYYLKGYNAVGMDELRAQAGVSLRRLYALFPSKTNVITAVLQQKRATWRAELEEWMRDIVDDPRERALAIYTYLEHWFSTDGYRGCAFINAFGELGGTHPDVAAIVREHKAEFHRYIASFTRDLGAPDELGMQMAILAEGAMSTSAVAGDPSAARVSRAAAKTLIDAWMASQ